MGGQRPGVADRPRGREGTDTQRERGDTDPEKREGQRPSRAGGQRLGQGPETQRRGMGTQSGARDWRTDLEDLEASNVQDAQEGGALAGTAIQGPVEAQDQPAEEALVGGLGQSLQCEVSLQGRAQCKGRSIPRNWP